MKLPCGCNSHGFLAFHAYSSVHLKQEAKSCWMHHQPFGLGTASGDQFKINAPSNVQISHSYRNTRPKQALTCVGLLWIATGGFRAEGSRMHLRTVRTCTHGCQKFSFKRADENSRQKRTHRRLMNLARASDASGLSTWKNA